VTRFDNLLRPQAQVGDKDAESALRVALLARQRVLQTSKRSVIVIIAGINGGGTGQVIRSLSEWLDPRYVRSYTFSKRSEEERERPPFWRYWMSLPARGNIATYTDAWYTEAIRKYAKYKITKRVFSRMLGHIQQFESDLVSDGTIILKYWLHLESDEQKARFDKLLGNPETAWRVSKEDLKSTKYYSTYTTAAARAIEETDSSIAPWQVMSGVDPESCAWFIGRDIEKRVGQNLDGNAALDEPKINEPNVDEANVNEGRKDVAGSKYRNMFAHVDLQQELSKSKYKKRLARYQARLADLHQRAKKKDVSTIVVFEGWDAAGKGGAIRRITYALDPRQYRVIRVAAPTDEELARHYLWRFWRHIPRAGNTTIYDRSWYGRVLVERVEGFAQKPRWQQAYDEINDFEQALVEHGSLMIKFWLHISPDEQLRRFKQREQIPHKHHKITEEDYRNREKWDDYCAAANEMIARTDTSWAPWQIIAANDKRSARVKVLEQLCDAYEQLL